MPLVPGTLLRGRYRLSRALGQGAYGAVYLAAGDRLGGRPCSVKEIRRLSAETEPLFLQEAVLLAGLRHPSLPRVTDYFVPGREP